MKYLVTYDVTDDKRRNKLHKLLLSYGINVEFSVFEINVRPSQLNEIVKRILEIIDKDSDVVYIFPYSGDVIRNGIYSGKEYGDVFV
ncbi:CRISPR-associated endonuclease Cas2 [Persephonella sp.]